MPTFIHTTEAEVTILSRLSTNIRVVRDEISVACRVEAGGIRVVDSEGNGFASNPVAGVVAVAVGESDFDAVFEEVRDVFEPAGAIVVADRAEGGGDSGGR